MKPTKVIVTESGFFNEVDLFQPYGVLFVDSDVRRAVHWIVGHRHCLPIRRDSGVVVYRQMGTSQGYRLSIHYVC